MFCAQGAFQNFQRAVLQRLGFDVIAAILKQAGQVAERKRDWPTRYDAIAVNPESGAVTDRVDFAQWPLLAKLARGPIVNSVSSVGRNTKFNPVSPTIPLWPPRP